MYSNATIFCIIPNYSLVYLKWKTKVCDFVNVLVYQCAGDYDPVAGYASQLTMTMMMMTVKCKESIKVVDYNLEK